ncbi:MAG: amidohydrolase family protein [Clostridia bacterium]|nr:amidohydrolase family protein [Clostridia bacterium]
MKRLTNGKLLSCGKIIEGVDILVDNGVIADVVPTAPDKSAIDLNGNYIAPGFIELHCHGAMGYEFMDGTEEAYFKICEKHAAHGTKIMYPTFSAADFKVLYKALETFENIQDELPLEVPGVHLEGPYFALEMSGAQNPEFIHEPRAEEYVPIIERFGHLISRWSYAPELDKDNKFLDYLITHNITPAIGHSAAEYSHVISAFEKGNRLITHLYSCTSTITRHGGFRHLGIIESAYLLDDMYVEAIADGCHLPPELLRLIVKQKGTDRVALITDSIRAGGMTAEEFNGGNSGGMSFIIEDGVAKLSDRSAFAGSIATSDQLLKRTVAAGISLEDTVKMMTETPANIMGLKTKGKIEKGFDAVFTVFDKDLNIVDFNF